MQEILHSLKSLRSWRLGASIVRQGHSFYEPDRKAGYGKVMTPDEYAALSKEAIRRMPYEFRRVRKAMRQFPVQHVGHTDYKMFCRFRDLEDLEDWAVTVDADHSEGRSEASVVRNERLGTAVFQGFLRTEAVKTGEAVRAGYANIRSPHNNLLVFYRPYNWQPFTHLVIRYRGDGRNYALNLTMHRFFDVGWFDQYQYFLFTRGGPYWQTAKIPFSKFFFSHKGRNQDRQSRIDLENVKHFSITVADSRDGPFKLELDYVALYFDKNHTETFAYELYTTSSVSKVYN